MTGHVRKRGKSWAYVVDLPPGPDGRRRQKWRSGFRTRKAAEAALAETIGQVHRGTFVEPSRATVSTYLIGEWLPGLASTVRPSTWASYSTIVRTRIVPRIGGVPLQVLGPAHLNALYAELLASGGRDGKPLSARSVRLTHATIRKALADAVRWQRLARNPADRADPPSAKTERESRRAAMRTTTLAIACSAKIERIQQIFQPAAHDAGGEPGGRTEEVLKEDGGLRTPTLRASAQSTPR